MKRNALIIGFAVLILAAFFLGMSDVIRLKEEKQIETKEENQIETEEDQLEDLIVGCCLFWDWPEWNEISLGIPKDTEELKEKFEELNGISFVTLEISAQDHKYNTSCIDDIFADCSTNLASSEKGQKVELRGTLYISEDVGDDWKLIQIPVYQRPTGEVYLQQESIAHIIFGSLGQSMKYEDEKKWYGSEGSERVRASLVELQAKGINRPETTMRLLQLNAEHEILAEQTYDVKVDAPESFEPLPETAYLLLEIGETDREGKRFVRRSLCQPVDESFSYFVAEENGLCEKRTCVLCWAEKAEE